MFEETRRKQEAQFGPFCGVIPPGHFKNIPTQFDLSCRVILGERIFIGLGANTL